jgi:hypothetical protein
MGLLVMRGVDGQRRDGFEENERRWSKMARVENNAILFL